MSNLVGNIAHFDGDVDMLVTKILTNWDCWTQKKSLDVCQDTSQTHCRSMSPDSFDSMCSSPEMPTNASGCQDFPYPQPGHGSASFASQKPFKPKMSTKRRMKASEREKLRMRSLADALHQLRDYLPPDYTRRGQPLTKIQTLKYTIQYINDLSELLRTA